MNLKEITIEGITYDLSPRIPPFPETKKKWRAKKGESYSYLNSCGSVGCHIEEWDEVDDYHYLTDNYKKTEEEYVQEELYREALGRINHRIHEMNGGWIPNWNSNIEYKYLPELIHTPYEWITGSCIRINNLSIFTYARSGKIIFTLFVEMKDDFETVRKWVMQ